MIPAAAVAALAGIALGLWVPGGAVPVDHGGVLLEIMVQPTEPYVLLPAIALLTAWCAGKRRWDGVLLCLAGSLLPVAVNTWLLKPLFDRPLHDYLAYPSGHTVSLVAVLTVVVLLAKRMLVAVLAGVVTVIAGVALVGLGYHYPVDVAGGACFAVAMVLTIARALRLVPVPSAGSPRGGTSSGSPPATSPR